MNTACMYYSYTCYCLYAVQNTDLTFSNPFAKTEERIKTTGGGSSRREAERQAMVQLDRARV